MEHVGGGSVSNHMRSSNAVPVNLDVSHYQQCMGVNFIIFVALCVCTCRCYDGTQNSCLKQSTIFIPMAWSTKTLK